MSSSSQLDGRNTAGDIDSVKCGESSIDSLKSAKAIREFYSMSMPPRIDIQSLRRFTVKNYELNVDGVRACIHDNGWNEDHIGDVSFAVILVTLSREYEATPMTHNEPIIAPPVKAGSLVTKQVIETADKFAKPMMMAALHAMAQGLSKDTQNLIDSFCAVYGFPSYIPKSRLNGLLNSILATTALEKFCKIVTLGELNSENEVLKKHLHWLSSADLVITALRAVQSTSILKYVDLKALEKYVLFYNAGIASQIASGPLKVYCKGKVNPQEQTNKLDSVRISDQCLSSAPYDTQLLKQAKIILEEYDIPHGKWYQGEKAMKIMNMDDSFFILMVRSTRHEQQKTVVHQS